MEIVAYTYSDVVLVSQILSQIAMLFDGGAFNVAAKLCAIIGIIVAIFSGIFKGGQLTAASFVWPIMVTVLMITPKVDLVIEDRNGGLARVDDLPIGFAAPISIITSAGTALSNMMTANLGLEDNAITMDNGHLVALRAPIVYQQIITVDDFRGKAATFSNGLSPIKDTIIYVDKCLKPQDKLAASNTKYANIQNRDFSTFRVTGGPATVPASNGKAYECANHYDLIMAGFQSAAFQAALNDSVNKFFSKYEGDTTTGPRYQAALQTVVSDLPRFYAAIAWANAVQRAPAQIIGAAGGGSHEAALNDALNQRREKNYGTAAIVFETIEKTISFMEVWSFSILPLVLLLLMIGPIGSKTAVKYFWMLVWIQFWYPTILIVMGYLDASLQTIGSSFVTIGTFSAFITDVIRLQDVGYLYLSIATALSMFIVFGTSSALATSMQKDMSGAEHYDQKKNAPDTIQRQPENVFATSYTHSAMNPNLGVSPDKSWLGTATVSIGHGVSAGYSASEAATFAGTGSFATSSSYGTSGSQNRMQTSSNSEVAAHSESVGNNTRLGYSLSTGAGANVSGDTSRSNDTSVGIEGRANVGFTGASKIGTVGAATAGLGGGLTYNNNHRNGESNKLSYSLADEMSSSRSGDVVGSSAVTESDTKSKVATVGYTSSTEMRDGSTHSEGISWGNTETSSRSKEDMVYERSAVDYKLTDVAGLVAGNDNAYAQTVQAVRDARLDGEVESFMNQNSGQLDKLYSGPDSDKAKYAMSAHFVMQGLGPMLYADDTAGGAERREAINAVSDDIIKYAALGSPSSDHIEGPSLDNLPQYDAIDPSRVLEGFKKSEGEFNLDRGVVRDAVNNIDPTIGDPAEVLETAEKQIGIPFERMTPGQLNGFLSNVAERIEEQHGPINPDKMAYAEAIAEHGPIAGIYNALGALGKATSSAWEDNYEDLVYATGNEFPDRTTGNANEVDAKADQMVDGYMDQLVASNTVGGKSDLAQYMAVSGLLTQAGAFNDEALMSSLSRKQADMKEADPVLAGPAGDTIAAISAGGFTGREYMRAKAEYGLGALTEQLSATTGHEGLNSIGENVKWTTAPDAVGRGTISGGGTTLPKGSAEDILLSFIGSLEAPRGYDDFERASGNNPPPEALSNMSIGSVMQWQDSRIVGQETRAAGRYQMTGGSAEDRTFHQAMQGAGLTKDDKFTPENQDRMGSYLLEQAGFSKFHSEGGSAAEFGTKLAGTWAILPKMTGNNPEASVYQGVQGNKSGVSTDRVYAMLDNAKQAPRMP